MTKRHEANRVGSEHQQDAAAHRETPRQLRVDPQHEHLAIEALHEIARRDPDGSGEYAKRVLNEIAVRDANKHRQAAYDKERANRLANMVAPHMGDSHHKTTGPMSVQEIETGPGNRTRKTVDWDNPRNNLQPQTAKPGQPGVMPGEKLTAKVGGAGAGASSQSGTHDLQASNLIVERPGGGLDEKKSK